MVLNFLQDRLMFLGIAPYKSPTCNTTLTTHNKQSQCAKLPMKIQNAFNKNFNSIISTWAACRLFLSCSTFFSSFSFLRRSYLRRCSSIFFTLGSTCNTVYSSIVVILLIVWKITRIKIKHETYIALLWVSKPNLFKCWTDLLIII